MADPIITIVEIQCAPGRGDEAVEAIGGSLVDTRAFDGCVRVDLLRDREDPDRVVLIEVWASAEQDAAYRAWRAEAGAVVGLDELLAGPPAKSTYSEAPAR